MDHHSLSNTDGVSEDLPVRKQSALSLFLGEVSKTLQNLKSGNSEPVASRHHLGGLLVGSFTGNYHINRQLGFASQCIAVAQDNNCGDLKPGSPRDCALEFASYARIILNGLYLKIISQQPRLLVQHTWTTNRLKEIILSNSNDPTNSTAVAWETSRRELCAAAASGLSHPEDLTRHSVNLMHGPWPQDEVIVRAADLLDIMACGYLRSAKVAMVKRLFDQAAPRG